MSLNQLLQQIDENQAKITANGKFDDAILKKINYKFRLDWNYYSNRMEGGTLTREETRSVMVGNISVEGKPIKDVMEMNGHDKVVLEILKIGKAEQRLSESRIKEIHKAIMHEENSEKANEIGQWKKSPNEVINYKNEKIVFAPPSEVANRIHSILDLLNTQLDSFLNNKKEKRHPLLITSDFHLNFISVHPFYDGNGRTTRIFTNLILIACGLPVVIIKDDQKDRYYRCLADIQAYSGNPELFYSFIAERIIESQNIILNAIAGKEIEEIDDLDKRIALLEKKVSTDDKVKERRSAKSISAVLSKFAFPLFEQMQLKCEKLNGLFFENSNIGAYTDESNRIYEVKNRDQSWEEIKQNWLENKFLFEKGNMKSFQFEYMLNGFKKNIDAQSVTMRVTFWFDTYNYTIMTQWETRDQGFKKAYMMN